MGNIKLIVHTPEKLIFCVFFFMEIYSRKFFRKFNLLDSIVIIKSRLGSPAYMYGACYMFLGPFQDFLYLIPVLNFFKLQKFYRSSCYNKAVIVIVLYIVKGFVE